MLTEIIVVKHFRNRISKPSSSLMSTRRLDSSVVRSLTLKRLLSESQTPEL